MDGAAPKLIAPADDVRAAAGIRRSKAWGGLAGFAVAGFSAYAHGDVLFGAGVRGLGGGIAGYLLAWLVALTVWRRILRAEAQRAAELLREQAAPGEEAS